MDEYTQPSDSVSPARNDPFAADADIIAARFTSDGSIMRFCDQSIVAEMTTSPAAEFTERFASDAAGDGHLTFGQAFSAKNDSNHLIETILPVLRAIPGNPQVSDSESDNVEAISGPLVDEGPGGQERIAQLRRALFGLPKSSDG